MDEPSYPIAAGEVFELGGVIPLGVDPDDTEDLDERDPGVVLRCSGEAQVQAVAACGLLYRPVELAPAGWFGRFSRALREDGVPRGVIDRAAALAGREVAGE